MQKLTHMLHYLKRFKFYYLVLVLSLNSCYKSVNANFETDKSTYIRGETITVTNKTEGAISYTWTFENETKTVRDPQFVIPETMAAGTYSVKLMAQGRNEKDVQTVEREVEVVAGSQITIWASVPLKENVEIFLDDVALGTLSVSLNTAPACNGAGTVSKFVIPGYHRLLGKSSSHTWKGTIIAIENECVLFDID